MDLSSEEDVESPCEEEIVQVPDSEETPPSKLSLADRLGSIFDEEKLSDVTFVVGQDEIPIKAHKLILVSRSPVFSAMFDGPMSEKGDVKIQDSGPINFKAFLRYLYTDEVDITEECVEAILYLSDKYQVISLRQKCEAFLEEHLRVGNACRTFELAHMYSFPNLINTALDFIGLNSGKCLKSEQFSLLSAVALDLISKSEKLNCNEECVFEALDGWATEKCKQKEQEANVTNKKEVLGATLYNVRFPLMAHDYLVNVVSESKLLPEAEILAFMISEENQEKKKIDFNPRRGVTYNTVFRFEEDEVSNLEVRERSGRCDAVSFQLSHTSWLYGVLIYGSPESKEAIIELEVHQNLSRRAAFLQKRILFKKNERSYTVLFQDPVVIKSDFKYTLVLSCYGSKLLYKLPPETSTSLFPAHQRSPFGQGLSFGSTSKSSANTQGNYQVLHTKNKVEDCYAQVQKLCTPPSIYRSFRHKTVHFYSPNIPNSTSLTGGQLPGLLLF